MWVSPRPSRTKNAPALTKRLEALRERPGFTGKAPGGPSRWSTERSGEWEPLRPELVVEVRYDHVTGDRFRHGTKLMRWRPDKEPRQCTFEQIEPPLADVEVVTGAVASERRFVDRKRILIGDVARIVHQKPLDVHGIPREHAAGRLVATADVPKPLRDRACRRRASRIAATKASAPSEASRSARSGRMASAKLCISAIRDGAVERDHRQQHKRIAQAVRNIESVRPTGRRGREPRRPAHSQRPFRQVASPAASPSGRFRPRRSPRRFGYCRRAARAPSSPARRRPGFS